MKYSHLIIFEPLRTTQTLLILERRIKLLKRRHLKVRLSRDYFLKCYQNVLPDGKYVGEAFYTITHQETINKVKLLFIWLSILMAGMTVNPLMAATLSDSELGSLDTLIAPHAYPWNMSTIRGYIITMIYQAGFCTIAMSPSGTMSIFILLNWIAIKGQYEVLKRRIAALDDMMEGFAVGDDHTVVQRSNSYHQVMMDELAAVIEHYRHLKEISDDFIHAIRRSVSLSIFSFFSISVLLISSLILIEASFFGKTKWLNLLLVSLAFFVIKCNVGEYLNEMNDEVMFLLYSTKWFEQSIPYRKRMTTFFILLQNPLRIQFMGTYDINLALLMSLMQKVYAGIQVLLTVSK